MNARNISSILIATTILLLAVALVVIPQTIILRELTSATARVALSAFDADEQAPVEPVSQPSFAALEMQRRAVADPRDEAPLLAEACRLRVQGLYNEAQPLAQRALAVAEQLHGLESMAVAGVLNEIGMLCKYMGRFDDGELAYRRALMIVEKQPSLDRRIMADLYHNLGGLDHARGRYAQAEVNARRSVDIRQATGGGHAGGGSGRGSARSDPRRVGKLNEAESLYVRALAVFEQTDGAESYDVALNLNNLASLYFKQGKFNEAQSLYERALAIKEKLFGPDHIDVATTANNLAVLCKSAHRYRDAEAWYRRALRIFEKRLDVNHPSLVTCRANYARLLRELKQL